MKRHRLLSLACPVYFELLAGVVAGIIDMLWVARLGGAAVAAVAVATNTENLLLGVIMMAASGTTVLVAHAAGARDPGAVRSAVRGGWALFALITPVVAIGGWLFREPVARLVLGGHDGAAPDLAAGYFAVSLPGVAVFFAQNVLDGILKGTGDTRTPMRLAFLANALILVLDPLLIYGLLGLPELGVQGAALATVAGRSVALAAGFAALRRNRLLREAAQARPAYGTAGALRRTAATGLPMSGDFLVRMAGSLAMVAIVARLGVSSVAAYGIATKAMYVATMSFYAVRQAASILTARALGGGRDQRAATGRQAVLTGGALGAGAAVVLLAVAPWVMRVFGAQGEVAAAGTLFLRCVGPYLVLLSCFIALGGVFEGSGGSRLLVRVTLVGATVQLTLAYALSGLGLPGVCLAMGLSAALQCAAVAGLFVRMGRQREVSAGARVPAAR
ncbi:MATE family efflux transporter [Streptomyces sp. H10-C2]|uniref:MATE family efflux transporter n=1 Tax=unclassified Streptomyces TaxID=2593676 RepID=UPI0024B944F7|nr:MULTISPECIES: MATE family efflux transporter [unclassified Streptomyces]MDJ0341134.1 MATE family efflux transporter [Streptomyces sp. PH10-H1]MDJ0369514.1 MATE family efflux transporter [Streptomyces sp. H10-C2]